MKIFDWKGVQIFIKDSVQKILSTRSFSDLNPERSIEPMEKQWSEEEEML